MAGAGLAWTAGIGLACATTALFSFDPLRRRLPAVFEYRRLLNSTGTHRDALRHRVYAPPNPSRRLLGWAGPCSALELRALARAHGLDVALHLRFLRLLFFLFLSSSVLVALPLAATFYTASVGLKGIHSISVANVTDSDAFRLWLPPVFQVVLSAICVALVFRETIVFAQLLDRYRQSHNPANYAVLARTIPSDVRSHEQVRDFWENNATDVSEVHVLRRADAIAGAKKKFWHAVAAREIEEWSISDDTAKSLAQFREQEVRAAADVDMAQKAAETIDFTGGENAAIIVFKTRPAATQVAVDAHSGKYTQWKVQRAPEPSDVNWRSLSISPYQERFRFFLMCIFCALLSLAWTVVAAAATGLSNLDAIVNLKMLGATPFSFARDFATQPPIVRGFAQGFVPAVLISVVLALALPIHRRMSGICRIMSLARRDAIVRNSIFVFLVWVVAVAGEGLGVLSAIVHSASSPGADITALIAAAIPAHSGFIMNFVLVQGFFGASWALLQVPRVAGRRRRIQRARTTREIRVANDWRAQYRFANVYAYVQLVALLGIAYTPFSPGVTACALVYCSIIFPVAKYNLSYATKASHEGAGELFTGAIHTLLGSLTIAHLFLAALLGTRKAIGPAVIAGVPVLGVLAAHFVISRRLRDAREAENKGDDDGVSTESGSVRKTPIVLLGAYTQPEMQLLPNPVENLSGAKTHAGNNTDTEPYSSTNSEGPEVAKTAHTQRAHEARSQGVSILPRKDMYAPELDLGDDHFYAPRESSLGTSGEGRSYDWQDSRSSLGGVPFFQNTGTSRTQSNME